MSPEGELRSEGFEGFVTIAALRRNRDLLPTAAGVYAVVYPSSSSPQFLAVGTGGAHKGRNPNVSVAALVERWVEGPAVVYYGKADTSSSNRGLRKRLGEFLDFGAGKAVGHWGGRHTWQLAESNNLLVCWKVASAESPREIEKSMIKLFLERFGKQPFANIAA